MSQQETINWSRKSLEELQSFWNAHIEPDLARDGLDLDTRPTYQEITEAGYSGIAYALREHHDLTLAQFLATVGYPAPGSDDEYPWGIDAETTVRELESFIRTLTRRQGLAESTINTKRSRLATFAKQYRDRHGSAPLVERVKEPSLEAEEIERVLMVFDELDDRLESEESKLRYLHDVNQFYSHLDRRAKASFNPADRINEEYGWQRQQKNNQPLSDGQVRRLYAAADGLEERLLVLATCAWGLRRGEVAALDIGQFEPTTDSGTFDFDAESPRIVFGDERKNGPGEVTVHYGLDVLADRLTQLADRENWSGYLFPSTAAESGYVDPGTITARFKRLAERADVTVGSDTPSPQYGRRFWYTTYADAQKQLLESLDAIAEEQGSSDANVVLKNYLSESERRKYRREFMRERLAEAFETNNSD